MPAGFHQPTSDLESIVGIQFGIFSPDEIVKRSVVEVISQATYDGNEPKIGGLFDPRMGVLDNGKTCRSCGQTNHGCPGHFGHYRLARPVYFIQFLPMIRNILRCVCIRCSKLLIDKNSHARITKRRGESRWKAVLDACSKVSRCGQETEDGCGTVRPKTFQIEGIARIVAEWNAIPTAEEGEAPPAKDAPNKVVKQPLEVEYVLRLFRQILDEDVDFMGLSRYWCRPDWMICTVLPIPPPQVRPSVVQDNNQRSEDDLTHKLFEIIKSNKKLQEQINKNSNRNMIDELTTLLQYHVATLVDNKIPGVAPSAQRGGRPLKSLQQRIGSKEGRVRYNIQGKRVEQSARSVITGDPNISIAEVGVPMKIAMNLTRPEMVTVYNRDRLYKYVQNGAEVFPGAKSIVRKDGRMISLKHVNTKEIVLYNGDTVNRHLMDGDIILFNRQPTLHRMSMMGHRVRVLPYNTFRLNVTVTRPYNADFDGDEMNAHIPQSYEATVELQDIASVPMQIIRPRDAMPVIGVVQDALAGAYLATRPNNLFTRREFMNMMMKNKRFQDVPEPASNGRYTGQQIIGTLFPPINISMENSRYDADSQDYNKVKIREGVFSQGVLDKGIFNKAGKGIVHTIYNDYGPKDAVDFMDGLQSMIETYLIMKGFSVGISDLIADEETRKKMEQTINEKKKEVDDMILQVHMDLFTNNSGKSNQEEFEAKAIGILNKATVDSGKYGVESLSDENRLMTMVRSGSKGDATNVAQMIACVGQQAPEGRRIPYGFTDRTLPHYKMFDDGAEARGFVEGSFLRGLTPQEFFFHAMSGREGLIDTAVKTADTGYTQRQLIKAMEDLMTQHDGTVRDASGKIVQFHYGEDGINSTKIEGISLPLGKFSDEGLRNKFGFVDVDLSTILVAGTERGDDSEAIEEFVENLSIDRKMLIDGVFGGGRSTSLFAPLNIERIITNIKIKFNLDTTAQTSLTPLTVLKGIESIIKKTQPYNKIWCSALRFHLAPHKIIIEERFTQEAWDALVLAIIVKNMKSLAPPGELVGIVAAQSIGEPATQMSIDRSTFIVLNSSKKSYSGPAGPYIDSLLYAKASSVIPLGNDSVVLDLEEDIFILGVSDKEKTSWKRISQVSRHPANGGLVEVYTRSGRKTIATLSHSFLKRSMKGIVPVLGSDLKVGMRIPVATSISVVPNPTTFVKQGKTTFTLDKDFGWVCGVYLADGCLSGNDVSISKVAPIVAVKLADFAKEHSSTFSERNHQGEYGPSKNNIIHSKDLKNFLLETFNQGSYNKKIGTVVYNAPLTFIRGLISGFFDGDGNVNASRQQIRASSRSKELLQGINRLLGYCSMFGILSEEASIRIPDKTQYTLSIPRKYAKHYETVVGFNLPEKAEALKEVIDYTERDNVHSHQEMIDKIPELGSVIARLGKLLQMPGQSRTYGRWLKKESIGRSTLEEYVQDFKEMIQVHVDPLVVDEVAENLEILESALDSDVLWDEIIDLVYLDDPKTYVYDFTVPGNDSFMVDDNILVHNTLNSVDWDTEIIIAKNGKIITPQIGEFIDDYYMNCPESSPIQHLENGRIYIELNDGNDWKALSCDENGVMKWTKLEAITRHPVVNEDGSNTILEVELESGRSVKATKGESFLTMVGGKIVGTKGSDLKIGDELPIGNSLALDGLGYLKEISLREYLPPTDYLYGTEVHKALEVMHTGERHWFQKNQGTLFTVPYNRSDSFREAFDKGHNTNVILPGLVYNKHMKLDVSQIPETIELSEEFGYFVGAYLAEGMSNKTQVCITNNDELYLERVKKLMTSWNVGTHTVCEEREAKVSGIKGTTTSLIIHSTIIAKVMGAMFGRLSYDKTIPDWVLQAPDCFVQGLMDAYICGDGSVDKKSGCVLAYSVSKKLLVRLGTLLARYEIYSKMTSYMPELGNFKSVSRQYTLTVPTKYSNVFHNTFKLSMDRKQMILDAKFGKRKDDTITCKWKTTKDVIWDKVKSIKEVTPMKDGWVYDVTVEETRNFCSVNMLSIKDTFHQAGVSSKSAMTRGVPRLKELLKVTKNPKANSLTITLKPAFRDDKDRVREVVQDLELTLLRDIVLKSGIYYDPDDNTTIIEEDQNVIAFFKAMELRNGSGACGPSGLDGKKPEEEPNFSRWILRLEFDREKMFAKNITMDDVYFVIHNAYAHIGERDNNIQTIYSDYNSQKLVMRIRPKLEDNVYSDHLSSIKKFQNTLLNNTIIRGIHGIRAVTWRKDNSRVEEINGKYEEVTQYILDTDGTNFVAIMNHPAVDGDRLYSTNVHDIYEQLGIEATRATLYSEINSLFGEADINYRHLGLLCDIMTHAGRLMSADRYGINKMDNGPLAKACFEETEKILLRAALFGEMDPITGVSANIMTGQPIRAGTGFTQILLDEAALPGLMKGLEPLPEDEEEVVVPDQNILNAERFGDDENDHCAQLQTQMNMTLPVAGIQLEDEEEIEIMTI